MQGIERMDRELVDARMLAGHLVPAGSVFAFLAAHRQDVLPDANYADLFALPGVGRPSLPATRMAAIMPLQTLHDYSGRETVGAVRSSVRWKAACRLAIDEEGFHPSSLAYWRKRLAKSDHPHRVNDAVRKVTEQAGVLRGRRHRAADSTILDDAVATQDTVTQLVSALVNDANAVVNAFRPTSPNVIDLRIPFRHPGQEELFRSRVQDTTLSRLYEMLARQRRSDRIRGG